VLQTLTYTSKDATHFFGCSGGTGTLNAGALITAPRTSTSTVTFDVSGSTLVTNPDGPGGGPGSQTQWVISYKDPSGLTTGGAIMFYRDATNTGLAADAPAQLTEFTIRDAYLGPVNQGGFFNLPESSGQTFGLINYDVSYVNDQISPIAMEATNVPV